MLRSSVIPGLAAACVALMLPAVAHATAGTPRLYVSLGDSYATGFQPTSPRGGTRNGFPYQTVKLAARRGYRLRLVNLGCAGATSTSILRTRVAADAPCKGPGAPPYATTQVRAAEELLRRQRGRVGLITVAIGGNDVTACASDSDPVGCIARVLPGLRRNLTALLGRIRAAAGPQVRIVGVTYPNVILGEWVAGPPRPELARLSVVAFRTLINPALQEAYESVGGRFLDVTEATGGYVPLEQTRDVPPYGTVPVAVAEACRLTFFCRSRDIHATTEGYGIIAGMVARTLPRRH